MSAYRLHFLFNAPVVLPISNVNELERAMTLPMRMPVLLFLHNAPTYRGGVFMKRRVGIWGAIGLLSLCGCATKDFVLTHTDPLAERVGKLEARVNAIDGKLSQLGGAMDANKAAIGQANVKAQLAVDAVGKLEGDVKRIEDTAKKAEAEAARAESAAMEAREAAESAKQSEKKSEKIFKLEQKK
jgi:hypothetical protein